jgi:hypothetical protein
MIWFITILCITSVIFYFYFCFTLKVKNNLKEIQYLKADVNHYRAMFLCLRKKLQIEAASTSTNLKKIENLKNRFSESYEGRKNENRF